MNHIPDNAIFILVFFSDLFLTVLSGGISLKLASQPNLSQAQQTLLDNTTATWQLGTGSIFGLLGGHTLS